MEPDKNHIRHIMLYFFHRKKSAAEAARKICKTYPNAISERQCQEWFKRFREGDFDLSDRPRSGQPRKVDNDELRALVESDPRLPSRELAIRLGVSQRAVIDHLHEIGKVNRVGVWVPHELSAENLQQRLSICTSLLARQELDPFLKRIVTGDEKWVLYVNVERKNQWLTPGQKPIPTPKAGLHPKKVLLCVWWDIEGIIHFELLDMNETITANIYCQQLDRLKAAIKEKRPSLANRKGVILHQDNARPHTAIATRQKIKEFGWELLPHPPYSADIAASDYHLFRSLQHFLDGQDFEDKSAVKKALEEFFESKPKSFYRAGIEALPQRWSTIIDNGGHYIID
jgi:histone-lysine N-methyltransferase SETMAR